MTSVSVQNSDAKYNSASADEVRTLNGLIVGVLDNVDECRRAIFALEQQAANLQRRLYHRLQAIEQMQSRVRELGAEPAAKHSILAEAFATMLTTREPFTRNRKEDLLQDVERGEKALKVQFEHCLASRPLSDDSRDCIRNALDCVLSERDRKINGRDGWCSQNIITTPSPLPPTLAASFEAAV